jgi:hypothetical protein
MKNFKKFNTLSGWLVFTVALVVYWITMEPTASFWDPGEFIAASYKLQVPHPPGAPLFLLTGRLFSFLSLGDTARVAYWINFSSVLAGAFTSLFLFWSITLLGRKLLSCDQEENSFSGIALIGAGLTGSLAYTFTDSAWFSAVEAEVYSMSSFFTAFVVWAMLRWETLEDEARASRWLIFIFYMIGLSIGVHLLNLVAIPALALIFYFKKFNPGKWGIAATLLVSLLILFVIVQLIIPGIPATAGSFELFFVNSAGLPFGAGALIFLAVLVAGLCAGIYYSHKKKKQLLNVIMLALTFTIIGYSCNAIVMIRAGFNPPVNENNPSDLMSFTRYVNREQYGTRPLLYGQYFTAEPIDYIEGEAIYAKGKDNYELTDHRVSVRYAPGDQTILPRIWSTDEIHQKVYRSVLGLRDNEKPDFSDNLRFMFRHQIGWMYMRYFLFNFAGRESDEQDAGWIAPGDWFEKLPAALAENKGRNNFYMIPFVLGLIGMYYQFIRNLKSFCVVGLLFVLTGIALVIYLNSPPVESRERDYIYVGSFYTYCIWIGLAVMGMASLFVKITKNLRVSGVAATVLCLTAPVLLAKEGWDDHSRAKRYFSVDTAVNDLQSCAPDSILFTGGDNDTFPLWYAQDVENLRPDIRVIVSSYFNTHWYIEQAMRQVNQSKAIPFTLTSFNYREGGPNSYLHYYDFKLKSVDLKEYLKLLKAEYKGLRVYATANVVPARDLVLKIDPAKIRALKIVPATLDNLIVPEMHLRLKGRGLEVKDLAMLDILATADWERPVYVTATSLAQFNVDLAPYAVREGNTYRILPVLNPEPERELVNTKAAYTRMMNDFQFRGLDDPRIYYSDDYRKAVQNHRNNFNTVAAALIDEGNIPDARSLLIYMLDKMPDNVIRYDITQLQTIQLLFETGEKEKAFEIASLLGARGEALIQYYLESERNASDLRLQLAIIRELARLHYLYGEHEKGEAYETVFNKYADTMVQGRM